MGKSAKRTAPDDPVHWDDTLARLELVLAGLIAEAFDAGRPGWAFLASARNDLLLARKRYADQA